jgi:hypothetical protein
MADTDPLAHRPRWGRYPIPYVTKVDREGRPDFRAHDHGRRLEATILGLCQLCGKPLGPVSVFVGQRSSNEGLVFGEPPVHESCVKYAWEICPWLAGGTWRPPGADEDIEYISEVPLQGRDLWMVWAADWALRREPGRPGFYSYAVIRPVLWTEHRRRGE